MPRVRAMPRALPTSRKTRLATDITNPTPRASKIRGAKVNGMKIVCHFNGTPYEVKITASGTRRTTKSKIGEPALAKTRATFGKLTLVTREPAAAKQPAELARQPAKSCQRLIPQSASATYGTGVSLMGIVPDVFRRTKTATVAIEGRIAHK